VEYEAVATDGESAEKLRLIRPAVWIHFEAETGAECRDQFVFAGDSKTSSNRHRMKTQYESEA
jgi:hypothetical protein